MWFDSDGGADYPGPAVIRRSCKSHRRCSVDTFGIAILIVGALVVGWAYRFAGENQEGFLWLITAIGSGVGGFIGSESLGGASTWGPEAGGLFLVPALIGAVVVGGIVEWVVRQAAPKNRAHGQPV